MSFNSTMAAEHAIAIVQAGLQNGTIKLCGSMSLEPDSIEKAVTSDATYLESLLKSLTAAIQKLE